MKHLLLVLLLALSACTVETVQPPDAGPMTCGEQPKTPNTDRMCRDSGGTLFSGCAENPGPGSGCVPQWELELGLGAVYGDWCCY